MNSYLLARGLNILLEKKHIELPRHLVVGADNTPRESKNQWFGQWLAYLAGTTFERLRPRPVFFSRLRWPLSRTCLSS